MRACSFVLFLIIDQFYSGLNWDRLFIGGLVIVAIWTDCERWLLYKLKAKSRSTSL
jgi:hypothetical protein